MRIQKWLVVFTVLLTHALPAQDVLRSLGVSNESGGLDNVLLQLDNDLFSGSDRDYTSGVRLAFGGKMTDKSGFGPLGDQLRKFSGDGDGYRMFDALGDFNSVPDYAWGISLTQLMFTPEDNLPVVPPPGQRPYAAWMGLEFSVHARDEDSLSSAALALGVTGQWALGEELQDIIHHDLSHSPFFNGWDSQLQEEVTLNLYIDHKRRIRFLNELQAGPFGMDGYYDLGGSIGNFRTHAYVGGLVRAGYNLTHTYSVPRLQLASYANQHFRGGSSARGPVSTYLMGGVRGSAVAHDMTLDGSLFRDWQYGVNSKPLVGEVMAGLGLRLWEIEAVYAKTWRSEEFESQNSSQKFGSLQIIWSGSF